MSRQYLIYKFTSPSNKSYIGRTYDLQKRIREHSGKSSGCPLLCNAIQKYGIDNFKIEIIEQGMSLDEANAKEVEIINEHNTLHPNGYNIQLGGTFHNQTEFMKSKISQTMKSKPSHPSGYKLSEETKLKMSASKKGKPPNNKGKICKNKGVPLSDERKLHQSQCMRSKMTTEKRKNNSFAQLGKTLSNDHKQKISNSMTGIIRPIVICPHCGKSGSHNNMIRYHFNNCKLIQ